MKNNVKKVLDEFVDEPKLENEDVLENEKKSEILNERSGLIERVDKVLVVNRNGKMKQLLREQY